VGNNLKVAQSGDTVTKDLKAEDSPLQDSRAQRWLLDYPRAIPVAIFLAIAAITAFSVFAIENNARGRDTALMREYGQSIASVMEQRGTSFSSYLRTGAALISTSDDPDREAFRQFVSELRTNYQYRGTEGIGWIEVVETQDLLRFEARLRAKRSYFPDVWPAPADAAEKVAPVTIFAPDSERNRHALGFDMYSEQVRADAMAEAKRTVSPTASGRIVLAQDRSSEVPGFIIFMPVYTGDPLTRDSERSLAGYVYSPFNAERFLEAAIEEVSPSELGVRFYDGAVSPEHLLVARSSDASGVHSVEQEIVIANRQFVLVIDSAQVRSLEPLSMLALLFGLAVAVLLMLLARLLTRQAVEDRARVKFYQEQLSIRNSLTRELNHRVKNTLANVLSILSLTRRRANSLEEFADSLEGRVRSLSATHDLLTGTDWGTTPLANVVEAELQHFRLSSDNAVFADGPPVELAPNDALSFGLALHELATNAAKYGSLSVPGGKVAVSWKLIDDHLAEVEWIESDGPPVPPTRKRGFGMDLIEKIVAHEMRHPVELTFDPAGVHCIMRIPVRMRGDFQIREQNGKTQ
jgi:two-component sensor histidine kinase